MKKKLTKVQI